MYATTVDHLKENPAIALKEAETQPVLVLKQGKPNAFLVHVEDSTSDSEQLLKLALASSLFKEGFLSLSAASQVSGLCLSEFIKHLASLDIDVVVADDNTAKEQAVLDKWLS